MNRPFPPTDFDRTGQVREKDDSIDLDWLLSVARRRFWIIVGAGVVSLVLGFAYLLTAVPLYSAYTDILVDQRRVNVVQDAYAMSDSGAGSGSLENEVQIIDSERVARRVVEQLDLINNPAFLHPPSSPLGNFLNGIAGLFSFIGGDEISDLTDSEREARISGATRALRGLIGARPLGATLVVRISVIHSDPRLAAALANAVANAYINDQMESTYDATRQASVWLQSRIDELQQQSAAADKAAQDFMTRHNLVESGNQSFADQQLAALNSQLIAQRASVSQLLTRYQHLQALIDSKNLDAVASESLNNSIINGLRSRYLEVSKRRDEFAKLVGPDHLQVKDLDQQLAEYSKLMFDELSRIAQGAKSDYEVANAQQKSLETQVAEQMAANEGSNSVKAQLADLQRQAKTFSDLHQNYLTRYQQLTQQQTFPVGDAQILNHAEVPGAPSSPQKTRTLAMSLILGLLAGAAGAALLEFRDRVFRTGDQIREELGLEFFGNLPLLSNSRLTIRRRKKRTGTEDQEESEEEVERKVSEEAQIMSHSLRHPISSFAETLRSAKVGIDLALSDQDCRIIGVTSLLPGEGKSTVAKNFASLLAQQGAKTLLIDADLRHPALSRSLIEEPDVPGLLDIVLDQRPLHEMLAREASSGLMFLPSGYRSQVTHTSDILASAGARSLLGTASKIFSYVVVDLPPIGPVVDAKAAASQVSAFVFVVEWGKTAKQAVRAALANSPEVKSKCVGVVYNKVDERKLKLYAKYGGIETYYDDYNKYYRG